VTARDLCAAKLVELGYSGLCGEDCGCGVEDLMPCGEPWADCLPGYTWDCTGCAKAASDEGCDVEGGGSGGCYRTERQA
jgi:hypothetical protein